MTRRQLLALAASAPAAAAVTRAAPAAAGTALGSLEGWVPTKPATMMVMDAAGGVTHCTLAELLATGVVTDGFLRLHGWYDNGCGRICTPGNPL